MFRMVRIPGRLPQHFAPRRIERLLPSRLTLILLALVLLLIGLWTKQLVPNAPEAAVTVDQVALYRLGTSRQASFLRLLEDRETLLVGGVVPIDQRLEADLPRCRVTVVSTRPGRSSYTCRFVHETWETDHHNKPWTSFVWFFTLSPRIPHDALKVDLELPGLHPEALPVALPPRRGPQHYLSVCVPVLQNNADALRVVEWLHRMRRLHDVSFVRMYLEANWRPALVAALLEHARGQRLPQLELLAMPHPLPMHYFGQYLAIYDCWLREATVSTWTLFMDLDEEVRILQPRPMSLRSWLRGQTRHMEAAAIAGYTLGSWLYRKRGIGVEPEMAESQPVCLPPRQGWQPLNQVDAGGTRSSRPPPERCLGPPGRRKLLLQADKMRQIQIHKAYALSGYRIVDLNTSTAHVMHYRGYVRSQLREK